MPTLCIISFVASSTQSVNKTSYLLVAFNNKLSNCTCTVITSKTELRKVLQNLNLFQNEYTCDTNTASIIKDITGGGIDYSISKRKLIRSKINSKLALYTIKQTFLKHLNLDDSPNKIRDVLKKYEIIPTFYNEKYSTERIINGSYTRFLHALSTTSFFSDHFKAEKKNQTSDYINRINKRKTTHILPKPKKAVAVN